MSEQSNVTDLPLAPNLQDQLGLSNYMMALCSFVKTAQTPMTIVVQGEWGCGKTSLMNSLYAHCYANFKSLLPPGDIPPENIFDEHEPRAYLDVWVNTWQYSMLKNDSDPQVAVIKGVAREMNAQMDKRLCPSSNAKEVGRKLMNSLGGIALTAAKVGIHSIGLNPESLDDFRKTMQSEQEGLEYVRRKFEESVETYLREYNERQRARDKVKGFIFFIDDPPLAVQILSLLKNLFEAENCILILAIDYEVVVEGLVSQFGEKTENNEKEFRSFFDKIIQLSFRVPIESHQIDTFLKSLLTDIKFCKRAKTLENQEFLSDITNLVVNSCGKNPRSIKRMVNTLSLVRKIHEFNPSRIERGYPETFLKLLMAVVCMQSAYPRIYEELLKRQNLFEWMDNDESAPQSLEDVKAEVEDIGPGNFILGNALLTDPWINKRSRNLQNLLNMLFHLCMEVKFKDLGNGTSAESNLRTTKGVLSQVLQASKLTFAESDQDEDLQFENFEDFVGYWSSTDRQSEQIEEETITELSDFCEIFDCMAEGRVVTKFLNNEIRFIVNKSSGGSREIFWVKVVPTGFAIQCGFSKILIRERKIKGARNAIFVDSVRHLRGDYMKLIRERLKRSLGKNKLKQWHVMRNEFYSISDNEQIDPEQVEHDDSEENNDVTLEDQEQRHPAVDATDNESEEMELTEEETLRGELEEKQSSQ